MALPEWDCSYSRLLPKLNAQLFNSGMAFPNSAKCLPGTTSTISITTHVAGFRTDTAEAGRRAGSPDALRRRRVLCGEVSKKSAAYAPPGQRTAGKQGRGAPRGGPDAAGLYFPPART